MIQNIPFWTITSPNKTEDVISCYNLVKFKNYDKFSWISKYHAIGYLLVKEQLMMSAQRIYITICPHKMFWRGYNLSYFGLFVLGSVCCSVLRALEPYPLLGGGVPTPGQRLRRALDSVPLFSLLCFPSTMVPPPPLYPLQYSPGFLSLQCLLPESSLFLPIASSLYVSV